MPEPIKLTYTEALVREAAFVFWRRTVGVGFFVALALLLGSLLFLLWSGDRSWFVGAAGAFFVVGLGFAMLVWVVHLRGAMARFRGMGEPVATLALDESSFTLASGLGTSTLPWSAVKEVWCTPTFWLLLFSKAQFVTVPLASVPPDVQTFIAARVRAAGGKWVD